MLVFNVSLLILYKLKIKGYNLKVVEISNLICYGNNSKIAYTKFFEVYYA